MDRSQHEKDLQDLTKDLVDISIKGIINLNNQPGIPNGTAEYILFSETLVNSMVYLFNCGINPYPNGKED